MIRIRPALVAIVLGVLLWTALPLAGQSPEARALQEAIDLIESKGDYAAALIRLKVAATSRNRIVAARAMWYEAQAYERTDRSRAIVIYERLAADFGDQPDVAGQARARVMALRPAGGSSREPASNAAQEQSVWQCPGRPMVSAVSFDGTKYVQLPRGDLVVGDFDTCESRVIVRSEPAGDPQGYTAFAVFSRDGTQVAYDWRVQYRDGRIHDELRIVNVTGPETRVRTVLVDLETRGFSIRPWDWSPDGRSIAVVIGHRADNERLIGVVDVGTGGLTVLSRLEWRANGRLAFSPDGRLIAFDLPADSTSVQRDVLLLSTEGGEPLPAVVGPAWDEVVGWSPDGRWLLFVSDRRGPIGVWGQPMGGGKPAGEPVLLRPSLAGAVVGLTSRGQLFHRAGGSSSDGAVTVLPVDIAGGRGAGAATMPATSGWPQNHFPQWSPDGQMLAYASGSPALNGYYQMSVQSLDTGAVVALRHLPFSFMRSYAWNADSQALLVDGLDLASRPGIFRVDARTGAVLLLASPRDGARILQGTLATSTDGRTLTYVVAAAEGIRLLTKDLATGVEREQPLDLPGSGRKWYGNVSPDGRWIGATSRDQAGQMLYIVSLETGEALERLRVDASQGFNVGPVAEWLPDSSGYIARKGLSSSGPFELWVVPVEGREPYRLDLDLRDYSGSFVSISPDLRRVATMSGSGTPELLVLDGVVPGTDGR